MKTPEDEEFERIEAEGWRKRQIMAEDDDDIQDYKKPWVGLTNGEMIELSEMKLGSWDLILEVEAKLKDKNI